MLAGSISGSSASNALEFDNSSSSLVINGGSFSSDDVYLSGGNISGNPSFSGNVSVSGGSISGNPSFQGPSPSSSSKLLSVSAGEIKGNVTIGNDTQYQADIEITGGTINGTSSSQALQINDGNITISGGTIQGYGTIYGSASQGKLTISDGSISLSGISNHGNNIDANSYDITISDNANLSGKVAVQSNAGAVEISGGSITGGLITGGKIFGGSVYGNAKVSGGTISGGSVYENASVSGSAQILGGLVYGSASVSGGTVNSSAKIYESAKVSGGTINGSILGSAQVQGGTVSGTVGGSAVIAPNDTLFKWTETYSRSSGCGSTSSQRAYNSCFMVTASCGGKNQPECTPVSAGSIPVSSPSGIKWTGKTNKCDTSSCCTSYSCGDDSDECCSGSNYKQTFSVDCVMTANVPIDDVAADIVPAGVKIGYGTIKTTMFTKDSTTSICWDSSANKPISGCTVTLEPSASSISKTATGRNQQVCTNFSRPILKGGNFKGSNIKLKSGRINGGTFTGRSITVSGGTVSGGTFSGSSITVSGGTVSGGTFEGSDITVSGGTVKGGTIGNYVQIKSGTVNSGNIRGHAAGSRTYSQRCIQKRLVVRNCYSCGCGHGCTTTCRDFVRNEDTMMDYSSTCSYPIQYVTIQGTAVINGGTICSGTYSSGTISSGSNGSCDGPYCSNSCPSYPTEYSC